jgi:uncharacterized membrane protein YhaH (DUF805 family)
MDFKQAVSTCLRKYADFGGRASRSEYWWFVLFMFAVTFAVQLVLGARIAQLANLALLLPALAVGARRLHDMGKSGWFQLVSLVPILGILLLIYWLVQPSAGANEWGQPLAQPQLPQLPPGAV